MKKTIIVLVLLLTICSLIPSYCQDVSHKKLNEYKLDRSTLNSTTELNKLYRYLDEKKDSINPEERENYYRIGLTQATKNNFYHVAVKFSEEICDLYDYGSSASSEIDSFIHFKELSLRSAEHMDSMDLIGAFNNHLGSALLVKGEMFQALDYFYTSVEAYKKSNTPGQTTYPLSNISYIYGYFDDYENAIFYSKEGLRESQQLTSKSSAYNLLFKCGELISYFDELEEFDSSQYYLQKSLDLLKLKDNPDDIASYDEVMFNFYQSVVDHFLLLKDMESAKLYYAKMISNKYFDSSYGIMLQIRYNLGVDQIKEAGKLIESAPEFLKDTSTMHGLRFLESRSKYNEKIANFKDAYHDLILTDSINNKLDQQKVLKLSGYMQSKNELDKKESEIQILAKSNKLKSLQLIFSILGILIFLVASFIYYSLFRKLKTKNSQLLKQGEKIQYQSQQIAEDALLKEKLFGNISHELRTPLTLISNAASDLINENSFKNKDSKNVKLISNYSNQLLAMSNDILAVIKNDHDDTPLELFSFTTHEMFTHLKHVFGPKAQTKNINFEISEDQKSSEIIISDAPKLYSVLKNLIENSLKYNKEFGSIKLSHELVGKQLMMSIADSGHGIEENDIPHIFDRFYQTKSLHHQRKGGIGLGLSICKEHIEALQGKISVESQLEIGTTFKINVPIEYASLSSEQAPPFKYPHVYDPISVVLPSIENHEYSEDFVLIVEDNLELCTQLNDMLKKEYLLSFAHDGGQALQQIQLKTPRLIITDWMMPGMSGDVLIKNLKSNVEYAQIPILMLTAKNKTEDKFSLLRIGVDSYITKPFVIENLKAQTNHLYTLADRKLNDEEFIEFEGIKKADLTLLKTLEQITKKHMSHFEFTLASLSVELNISARQLNRKVKQLTGLTPKQYVNEVRFEEAKRLLENGEHTTVKAVIYSVGFKAEKNFSRNFKKRFGKYPKEILHVS